MLKINVTITHYEKVKYFVIHQLDIITGQMISKLEVFREDISHAVSMSANMQTELEAQLRVELLILPSAVNV